MTKERSEILIGGIGGQGVVYSANLIARSALRQYKFASSIAHYGPESRGSVTTSEVVISNPVSDGPDYPVVERPDVFIALHQKAYDEYLAGHKTSPEYLIYDSTLVTVGSGRDGLVGVPASQLAKEKLSNIMMANIILTAVFAKTTGLVPRDDLEQALKEIMPARDFTLGQKALEIGFGM
ncbi:MAG: 2-oxoacid:acceptor oxidoreductase family protein [Planctomycetota bacterium]